MDLFAHAVMEHCEKLRDYVTKHYGEPPRWRGVRLMRDQRREACADSHQMETYNGFVGQDVVYIHTRCGGSNYEYFDMDEWEGRNSEHLLAAVDDIDCSYRDTYLKAVPGEDYDRAVEALRELVGER